MHWTQNDLAHITDDGLRYLSQRHRDIYQKAVRRLTRVARFVGTTADNRAIIQLLGEELGIPFQYLENMTPRVHRDNDVEPHYPEESLMEPEQEEAAPQMQPGMMLGGFQRVSPGQLQQMVFGQSPTDPSQQAAFALSIVSLYGSIRYKPHVETSLQGDPQALDQEERKLYSAAIRRMLTFLDGGNPPQR